MRWTVPKAFAVKGRGADGILCWSDTLRMSVMLSVGTELDGKRWLHLSVARPSRLPSWEDLKFVRDAFIGDDKECYQVLPPAQRHVNIHPNCLHLWHCMDGDALPDFTRGGKSI